MVIVPDFWFLIPVFFEFLKKILYFTRDCGYSLDGVKKLLQSNKQQYLDPKFELIATLNEMKAMLLDMKSQLES